MGQYWDYAYLHHCQILQHTLFYCSHIVSSQGCEGFHFLPVSLFSAVQSTKSNTSFTIESYTYSKVQMLSALLCNFDTSIQMESSQHCTVYYCVVHTRSPHTGTAVLFLDSNPNQSSRTPQNNSISMHLLRHHVTYNH